MRRRFPLRLRCLRTQRGFSLTTFSAATGISKTALCALESGQQKDVNWSTLNTLARALDTTLDDLMGYNMRSLQPGSVAPKCVGCILKGECPGAPRVEVAIDVTAVFTASDKWGVLPALPSAGAQIIRRADPSARYARMVSRP